MKTFFSSTFMESKNLEEAGIYHPIKLEYYKIINEEESIEQQKEKFGINIIKTEYKKEEVKIENKKIQYVSNNEEKIEEILKILEKNEVTPITAQDILNDFSKQTIL